MYSSDFSVAATLSLSFASLPLYVALDSVEDVLGVPISIVIQFPDLR